MYGLKWNERYVFRKRIKEDALPSLFILRAGPYNREGVLDPPLAAINHLFPKIMEVSCFTFQSVHADPPHAPPLFFYDRCCPEISRTENKRSMQDPTPHSLHPLLSRRTVPIYLSISPLFLSTMSICPAYLGYLSCLPRSLLQTRSPNNDHLLFFCSGTRKR